MRGRVEFKLLLLPAIVLACALTGWWQAEGQRSSGRLNYTVEASGRPRAARSVGGVMILVNDNSFVLKNLKLAKTMSSTIIKGDLVNKSRRSLDEATFEIKAYDREGNLLKGVERTTIFTVHQLKANDSVSLNSGYGVWLQGIPLESIARIEVAEANGKAAEIPIAGIPFASHAMRLQRESVIEE